MKPESLALAAALEERNEMEQPLKFGISEHMEGNSPQQKGPEGKSGPRDAAHPRGATGCRLDSFGSSKPPNPELERSLFGEKGGGKPGELPPQTPC